MFGFLNCYKPRGMTSRDVVNIVQRQLRKTAKVGHAGTLDPLAEGVLVLGVGPAVRLVPYVQQLPKYYRATFRLGWSSDSGDLDGDVSEHPDLPRPSLAQLRDATGQLVGTIQQQPPAHSAIWVDGQRAYRRVRAGQQVEMPTRTVQVDRLDVVEFEYPDVTLEIECGSGTYVRTLGMDLAQAVGSAAVMTFLCRHAIGPFHAHDAISIDQLRNEQWRDHLIPPIVGVQHMPQCVIDDQDAIRLGHGLPLASTPPGFSKYDGDVQEAAAVTQSGKLRAIVRKRNDQWRPYRVFPTDE